MAVQAASLEILEKANVPPAQARAFVQAIEIEIAGARDTLATKQDLLVLRNELTGKIADLRTELTEKITDLRTEMHALASSNVRQMYTAMLGQTAVLLGIAYFFVAHLAR
ncbi:MAG TPA: hypothetical protein VEC59_02130 [Steroidobacteraceae bacterium]|nr:hypothetical protein [Steroidobacteraceae bacterium]